MIKEKKAVKKEIKSVKKIEKKTLAAKAQKTLLPEKKEPEDVKEKMVTIKNTHKKIQTAEGWKRGMLKVRKQQKKK